MRKEDIVIGGVYSNGKGAVRRVVDIGPEYILNKGQQDEDCVLYELIKGKRKPYARGVSKDGNPLYHSARASFAAWAKERIDRGE